MDVFQDFQDDIDTIRLHASLVAPGETVQDVIDNYATVANGNVVLTFDGGNVLTINGLTNASALVDDMILV
jgi:prophage tail gpP-like protein